MSESSAPKESSELLSRVTLEKRHDVYGSSTELDFGGWLEFFKSVSAGEKVKENGTEFKVINAAEIMREFCVGFGEIRKGKKATPITFKESAEYTFSVSSNGDLHVNLPGFLKLSQFSIDKNTVIKDEEGQLVFDGSIGTYAREAGWEEAMHLDYFETHPDYVEEADNTSAAGYDSSDLEYDALVKIYKKYTVLGDKQMSEIMFRRIKNANELRLAKGKEIINLE